MYRNFFLGFFLLSCNHSPNEDFNQNSSNLTEKADYSQIKTSKCTGLEEKIAEILDGFRVYSSLESESDNSCSYISIVTVGSKKPKKIKLNLSDFSQKTFFSWDGLDHKHLDEILVNPNSNNFFIEINDGKLDKKINLKLYFSHIPVLKINNDKPDVPINEKTKSVFQLDTYDEVVNFSAFSNRRGYIGFPIKQLAIYPEIPLPKNKKNIYFKKIGFHRFDEFMLSPEHTDRSLLRNLVSHEIYNKLSQNLWQDSAVNGFHVDVFYNNNYKGVFFFSNTINANFKNKTIKKSLDVLQMLNLNYGVTRYKGLTEFIDLIGSNIPEDISDLMFDSENYERDNLDLTSTANYLTTVYSNLGLDNYVNNIFFVRSSHKIHILPWDFEWSFGNYWMNRDTGHFFPETAKQEVNQMDTIFKLTKNPKFCKQLNASIYKNIRYLMNSGFITNQFETHFNLLKNSGAYERSHFTLPRGYSAHFGDTEIDQILKWVDERMTYLSNYKMEGCL